MMSEDNLKGPNGEDVRSSVSQDAAVSSTDRFYEDHAVEYFSGTSGSCHICRPMPPSLMPAAAPVGTSSTFIRGVIARWASMPRQPSYKWRRSIRAPHVKSFA
jgi:hypothetical protein